MSIISLQSKSGDDVMAPYMQLRKEQRNLANKLGTLEMDLREHKTVIETLKAADSGRKCFQLIGGVLCERTVKDVLPQLEENKAFIEKTITVVNEDITKKGQELNKYKDENQLKIVCDTIGAGNTREEAENEPGNYNILLNN